MAKPTYDELVGALQWLIDGLYDDYPEMVEEELLGYAPVHDYHLHAAKVLKAAGGHVTCQVLNKRMQQDANE